MAQATTERPTIRALANFHRAEEVTRILKAALEAAALPQIARLVEVGRTDGDSFLITMQPMRPDEARAFAAFIDRASLAVRG